MIFNAHTLARGWRSVAVASGSDKAMPAFDHALLIEQYPGGVLLVATDTFMMLHSWVPSAETEHDYEPGPELDEAPLATAIALDPFGRAKGFLAHAQQLAATNDDDLIEIKLDLGVKVVERDAATLAGLEPRWCVLEMRKRERLQLRLYEGAWPAWRDLLGGLDPVPTERVALNLDLVGRLAKLGKVQPGTRLGWSFTGPERPARVELIDAAPEVRGLVMPCRWDLAANAPFVEPDPDDTEAEASP